MSKVLGRKLFKKQSSRGKGITSMLEDFPQGFAEGGEVSPRDGMTAEERKRLATEMLSRAREEGYTFIEEGERPSLTRQAAVGAAPAMGPDPRAAQQLALMQQMGMMPPRFQQGGMTDTSMFRRGLEALRGDYTVYDPTTDQPAQFIDPTNPVDVAGEFALTRLLPAISAARGINRLVPKRRAEAAEAPARRDTTPEQGELFRGPSGESRLGPQGEIPAPRTSVPSARPAQGELFPELVVPVGPGGVTTSGSGISGIPSIALGGRSGSGIPRTGFPSGLSPNFRMTPEGTMDEVTDKNLREVPAGNVRDPFEEGQQAAFESGRGEAAKPVRVQEKEEAPKRGEGEETRGGGVTAPAVSKADVLMEGIKARREELKAEREQNKWMALMQAGLAMAAGRSPSALTNIGAGGIAGVQALREGQRDIRREERELMSDEMKLALTREQAAAEAAYRNASLALKREELAKEPANMQLIRALGGGDLQRGFDIYQSDERLKAASKIAADLTADPAARAQAQAYISSVISGAGAGNLPAVRRVQ